MTDKRIIARVLAGERDEFGRLVDRYMPMVHSLTCARLDDADAVEDAVQETFVKAFASLDALRDRSKFRQWIAAIARNVCASAHRARHREEGGPERADEVAVRSDVERRELHEVLHREIRRLGPEFREALLLHYFAGMKIREVAEALGIGRDAAAKRIQRARDALGRNLVEALGVVPPETEESWRKCSARTMKAIAVAPVSWEAGATAAGLAGLAKAVGGVLALNKAAVAILALVPVAIICAVAVQRLDLKTVEPVPQASETGSRESAAHEAPIKTEYRASAESPAPDSPGVAPAAADSVDVVTIAGEVVDAATGVPVPGVRVALARAPSPTSYEGWAKRSERDGRTDAEGTLRFEGVPAALHHIGVWDPVWVLAGREPKPALVQPRAGDDEIHVRLIAAQGGVVTGRVTDKETGEGIPGITLKLLPSGSSRHPRRDGIVTDAEGWYHARGLTDVEYCVDVVDDADGTYVPLDASPYGPQGGEWRQRFRASPGSERRVDFQLSKLTYATVSGMVVDETGRALPGVRVWVSVTSLRPRGFQVGGSQFYRNAHWVSDSDGRFEAKLAHSVHNGVFIQARDAERTSDFIGPLMVPEGGLHGVEVVTYSAGSIRGVLVNKLGEPITCAKACLSDLVLENPVFSPITQETQESGAFQFEGLPAGAYVIWSSRVPDHMMMNEGIVVSGRADPAEAVKKLEKYGLDYHRISLHRGEHAEGIRVEVAYGGSLSISGRVVNSAGEPIHGATVTDDGPLGSPVRSDAPLGIEAYTYKGPLVREGQTDESGAFRLAGLMTGQYAVTVRRYPSHEMKKLERVTAGKEQLEVTLREHGAIEGRVVNAATNQAVPEFEVFVVASRRTLDLQYVAQDAVKVYDEHGRFRVRGECNGDATLCVLANGYAPSTTPVQLALDTTLANMVVRLEPAARVGGRVVDAAGKPVAGAAVFSGAVPQNWGETGYDYLALASTQADGTFQLANQAHVPSIVAVAHPEFAHGAAPVKRDPAGSAWAEVVLAKGGTVEGTVTLDGTGGSMNVWLRCPDNESAGVMKIEHASHGRYEFLNVPPGLVEVIACPRGSGQYGKFAVVEPGKTTTVDFNIVPGTSVMTGGVQVRGEPAGSGTVIVRAAWDQGEHVRLTGVREGRYRLEGLPSGQARVEVYARCPRERSTEAWVELSPGGETVQDFDFAGTGVLEGQVVGQDPAEFVGVLVVPGEAEAPATWYARNYRLLVPVGPDGVFVMERMQPGTFTVFARSFPTEPDLEKGGFSRFTSQAVAVVDVADGAETRAVLRLR